MRAPLVLAVLLGSCAGTRGAGEDLRLAHRDVFDALQFGDFQVVAQYLRADLRSEFLSRGYGVKESLHLLEFEPITVDIFDDRARSSTRVSWYELPSTKVRTETVLMDWVRVGDHAWMIETISGGPLPVPDPAAEPPAPAPPPTQIRPTDPADP